MKNAFKLVMELVSNVVWLPWNNFGRHEAKIDSEDDRRRIGVTLANEGWLVTQPVKIVKLTKDGQAKAVEYLKQCYADLEKLTLDSDFRDQGKVTKISAAQIREAFKARWMPKGKVEAPEYEGVYAFQRGSSLDFAIAYAMQLGLEPIKHIPCYVVEYTNEADRIKDCMEENFAKDALLNDVTNHWPSIIQGANKYYEATGRAATLSDITRMVSGGDEKLVGRGQKAHAIVILNSRFPQLGIVDKIVKGGVREENGRMVDLGQEYGASLDRRKLTEYEQGTRAKTEKPSNPKDVEEYFLNPTAKTNAPIKPLTWKALNNVGQNSPNHLVRYILQASANEKFAAENLAALDKIAAECNEMLATVGLFKDGKPVFPKA